MYHHCNIRLCRIFLKASTEESWEKYLSTGDSLVVEVSYPACPGPRDKVNSLFKCWSKNKLAKLWRCTFNCIAQALGVPISAYWHPHLRMFVTDWPTDLPGRNYETCQMLMHCLGPEIRISKHLKDWLTRCSAKSSYKKINDVLHNARFDFIGSQECLEVADLFTLVRLVIIIVDIVIVIIFVIIIIVIIVVIIDIVIIVVIIITNL